MIFRIFAAPMKNARQHIKFSALLLAGLFLCIGKIQAQTNNTNYEIEARMHYGYLYFQNDQYHSALGRYSEHAPSFEFSLHRNTYGQHRWEVIHNYPSIGLTFYHSQFGNHEHMDELGQVFALYPFINFPIIPDENHKLGFKLGVGLSYLTNKFDPKENYHNYAIGSHVNAAINLSFEYRQRITDRLRWVTSFGLTHFSNGSTMTPNMGINIFSGATGFSWYLKEPKKLIDKRLLPKLYLFEFDGKQHFVTDIQYTLGYKDLSQQYGTHNFYYIHDLASNFMFQLNERDRLGVGIELVKDNSGKALNPDWDKEYYFMKVGFLVSYEMMLDRVSFMFNFGRRIDDFHFVNKNLEAPTALFLRFYEKLAVRYYFYDNMYATLAFTTYDIKADFLSFGIGYHFNHNYYLPHHEKNHHRSPIFPR